MLAGGGWGEWCPRPAPFLQPPGCPLPGDSVTCRSGSSSPSPAPAYPAQQRSRLSGERELHCRRGSDRRPGGQTDLGD